MSIQACSLNMKITMIYKFIYGFFGFFLPLVTAFSFYMRIFKNSTFIKKKALSYGIVQYNEMVYSLNVTQGGFASFVLFLFTYFPYICILIVDYKNLLPISVHIYLLLLSHFNSVFNPAVYCITNTLFFKGYRRLMIYMRLNRNRVNSLI
jgi:hypothetical protein